MDGAEGIGEIVTGGMAARAVEPGHGELRAEHAGGKCLNCGTGLQGEYCHACGQAGHVHRTLGAFWHDVAHSVLHFDGKVWRTLPMLAWRPGELTRRYVEGERAKFVSPMALFLFSVFLMFAVITAFGGPFSFDNATTSTAEDRIEAERDFREERAKSQKELDELRAERARLVAAGQETRDVDISIRNAERELALEERLFKQAVNFMSAAEALEAKQETRAPAGASAGPANTKPAKGEAAPAASATDEAKGKLTIFGGETGWPPLDKAIDKAEANPSLLFYKLQTNAYKFSWALIPISVPFVWMLFLHRRRYRQYRAYDHVVFVTYSIAFMSIGFIVLTLLRPLGAPEAIAGTAIAFAPPIHMYRQLRGAYRLSRRSALWRTFVLINFAFIAAGLFFTLLVMLGVLG